MKSGLELPDISDASASESKGIASSGSNETLAASPKNSDKSDEAQNVSNVETTFTDSLIISSSTECKQKLNETNNDAPVIYKQFVRMHDINFPSENVKADFPIDLTINYPGYFGRNREIKREISTASQSRALPTVAELNKIFDIPGLVKKIDEGSPVLKTAMRIVFDSNVKIEDYEGILKEKLLVGLPDKVKLSVCGAGLSISLSIPDEVLNQFLKNIESAMSMKLESRVSSKFTLS